MFKDEQKHPFYKPLWVRVAVVAVIAVMLGIEVWQGSSGLWMVLFGGMLAYAVYTFFITWPKDQPSDDEGPSA